MIWWNNRNSVEYYWKIALVLEKDTVVVGQISFLSFKWNASIAAYMDGIKSHSWCATLGCSHKCNWVIVSLFSFEGLCHFSASFMFCLMLFLYSHMVEAVSAAAPVYVYYGVIQIETKLFLPECGVCMFLCVCISTCTWIELMCQWSAIKQ